MTADIFIRTFARDVPWLRNCLRSIRRFGSGFNSVVIVTPPESHDAVYPLARDFGCAYDVCERMHHDDYIGQQGTKMNADRWCTADVISHVDSDVLFCEPFSPSMLIEGGKVKMLKTRYATLDTPWQRVTERVVGFPVEFEYMRRMPLSYPRELYPFARDHIAALHGVSFAKFIKDIPKRQLSEFNVLGAIAEKFMAERFEWIDTEQFLPPGITKQYWSWGGITTAMASEIEITLQN